MKYKKDYYKIAAKNYIDSGFNMKKTIKSLHPQLKEGSAEVRGSRLLRNVNFREELSTILGEISEEDLTLRLNELLNAKFITSYKGKAKLTDLPDYAERRKTIDMILELKDLYPARKIDKREVNMNIDLELEKMNDEEFVELLRGTIEQRGYRVIIEKNQDE